MEADLICGANFGDEGKGCVAEWLAKNNHYSVAVRTSGSNAGHAGTERDFHCIPVACLWVPTVYIPAAGVINLDALYDEAEWAMDRNKGLEVIVSPFAAIITEAGASSEFGSMGVGVGKTRIAYLQRTATRAIDIKHDLEEHGIMVLEMCFNELDKVLIEPGQGYGLSLHSKYYPHVTTIDLNPYAIAAESEIPFGTDITVWAISRFHPVRVPSPIGGSSGPMIGELNDFEQVRLGLIEKETWGDIDGQRKRICEFDFDLWKSFCKRCRPDKVVFSHFDKFEGSLSEFESKLGCDIDYMSIKPAEFFPAGKIK